MSGRFQPLNGADSAQGLADAIALVDQAGVTPSLNVERLAEATWNVNKRDWEEKGGQWPKSFAGEPSHSVWLIEAEAIAAEYQRLSGPSAVIVPRCIACSEPALPDSPYCAGHDRLGTYTAHESAGGIAANE